MQFLGDALFTIIDVKSDIVFGYWNLLKVMKNAFFYLKTSFCSQEIYVFVLTYWSCIKTTWLEDKVNVEIYDVKTWLTNNCNTQIAQ